jgi:hypothetical protein
MRQDIILCCCQDQFAWVLQQVSRVGKIMVCELLCPHTITKEEKYLFHHILEMNPPAGILPCSLKIDLGGRIDL